MRLSSGLRTLGLESPIMIMFRCELDVVVVRGGEVVLIVFVVVALVVVIVVLLSEVFKTI